MFSPRIVDVAVAIVFEPEWGFFLSYNPKWGGYAFPMRKRRMTDLDLGHTAALALRDATDLPLRGATYKKLVSTEEIEGESQRTRRPARYRYHVFHIDPPVVLSTAVMPHGFGCKSGFLKPDQITPPPPVSSSQAAAGAGKAAPAVLAPLCADLVTWTTRLIVEELIGNQHVGEAVICRRSAAGAEFLMNRNANYGGYYPIAARSRGDGAPKFEVRRAIETDTGYRRWSDLGEPVVVEESHFSPRFQCERRFVHDLFLVRLDGVDLNAPGNELEQAMERSGLLWRWVTDAQLDDPEGNDLSPTVAKVRDALRQIAGQSGCA
jgi:hypothetical protein